MKKHACIVLCTYNEVDNVPILIPRIYEQSKNIHSHDLHLIVVDDNSPDGTQDCIRELMKKYPKFLHLISGEKKGLGEAKKRGITYAFEKLDPDLIVEMDADLQHDAALLPLFILLSTQEQATEAGAQAEVEDPFLLSLDRSSHGRQWLINRRFCQYDHRRYCRTGRI